MYLIEEEGNSWKVHDIRPGASGMEYGRYRGTLQRPSGVRVGACTCR
jgi:hypothetical protein